MNLNLEVIKPLSAGMLLRKHDGTALWQQQLMYDSNIHQPLIYLKVMYE
jgi:hypothetical protein